MSALSAPAPKFPICTRDSQMCQEDRDLLRTMAEAQLAFRPNQTLAFVLAATDVIDAANGHCIIGQVAAENILRQLGVIVPTGLWCYRH